MVDSCKLYFKKRSCYIVRVENYLCRPHTISIFLLTQRRNSRRSCKRLLLPETITFPTPCSFFLVLEVEMLWGGAFGKEETPHWWRPSITYPWTVYLLMMLFLGILSSFPYSENNSWWWGISIILTFWQKDHYCLTI